MNQQFAAYSNLELGPDANIFDYFDLLNPDSSASDEEYLFDYECKYYSGKHGKIAAIKYSYNYGGKPRRFIECHREDIPYMVSGAFDDSLELSSGDIVLWVADSLKASEHFTIQDGTIKKK